MKNNEVIGVLNRLAETCRRGRNGFRNAGESIQNPEFRRLFNIFSQQRAQFVTELEAEAHRLGGDVGDDETAADKRTPENVSKMPRRAGIRDQASVIADCQRQEEEAVKQYEEALNADLPLDVQYVIKRQYMDIKDAYDRIRILQRAA